MNIYDMYFTSVYVLNDIISDKKYGTYHKTEYVRDALVLKKTKKNKTYYIDLFTKDIIEPNIYSCDIGDMFIFEARRYEPVVDYLNQDVIKNPNMSKRKIFKMLLENKEGEK